MFKIGTFKFTPIALSILLLNGTNVWAESVIINQTTKLDGWAWDASTQYYINSKKNALIAENTTGLKSPIKVAVEFSSVTKANFETEGSFISNAGLGSSGNKITYSFYTKVGVVKSGPIAICLTKQGTQEVNLSQVDEIIANNTEIASNEGVDGLAIIYTGAGSTSTLSKAYQTLGSFSVTTVRGTSAGKGFGVAMKDLSSSSSNASTQTVKSYIGTLGTEDIPLGVGVYAFFKDTGNRGIQKINSIGTIYATEAGVVNFSGSRTSKQSIDYLNQIVIDSSKGASTYPIIAGISGETTSRNAIANPTSAAPTYGQVVKIKEQISVEGNLSNPDKQPNSNVSYRQDEGQISLRAGILNRGGRQEIDSISQNPQGTNIVVGTKSASDNNNYAVLVYPFFSQSVTTTSAQDALKAPNATETLLKGSFNVVKGDVSVFGPQVRASGEEHYLKVGDVSLTLTNTTKTENGKTLPVQSALTLGEGSNLWITNRSFDVFAGHGLARANENTNFILSAGSGSDAANSYQINLTGDKNFIYVDGTFTGNSTINLGSTWSDQDKTIDVNKNPIVIKNIGLQTDGSKSHLNLNINLTSALPAAERDKFFDGENVNVQVLMRQAVENLMIGEGTENLEAGGLIIVGDQVNVGSFSETEKNLALKDSTQGIASRAARGYVTVTTPEGLITPQKTFVSQYYLDNVGATGKDPTAVLAVLNDKVNTAAAALHGKTLADTQSLSRAVDNEADIYASGSGAIYSQTELPTEATSNISNRPLVGDDTGKDNSEENSGENSGGNSGNNTGSNTEGNSGSGNQNGSSGGNMTTVEGKTSTMGSLESVGMSNYFVWREDVETLYQRLGEVRMTPELEGMWVRVSGGKNKYNRSSDYFSNKFYGIQLGIDRNIGGEFGWTVGAAFSYIDGDAKLANGGKDDNYFGSFSLYATKQFENAGYFDVIAKFSRLHNDFTAISNDRAYFSKGKYSTNAYQFGIEFGKKFAFGQNWFIDPQIQLTYGHINKTSYKTNTGVNTKVKGINSLIGRVGVAGGYQNDKLSAFVKVDALRDFTAKYKADYQVANVRNHSSETLKDTWGEIAAGTTVNFGKNVKGYAQVKRSFAAKVKQEYRADIGLRLVF